ncbi:uncharacterized protein VTP21DRAFT_4072 [Calcarisporiella thermophila]|uniref:uncharacterized protein n=1 Tax=Calcarisporiella thermophila TaxID=911321 RepID=UPI003741F410
MDISKLFSVKGKVVLVTGGSRGIGEMIANGFISNGAKVYIASRSTDVCNQVAARLNEQGPGQCISIPADLKNLDGINRLVEELMKQENRLDVLVNNAGVTNSQDFDTYTEESWDDLFDINLKAPYFLTKALIPLLSAKCTQADPSRVIMIGSVAAMINTPMPSYVVYNISKAALHRMTEALAPLLSYRHITVNSIAPGYFRSELTKDLVSEDNDAFLNKLKSAIPAGRFGESEDIAGTCIYLASRAGAYTNGATIVVDGCMLYAKKS